MASEPADLAALLPGFDRERLRKAIVDAPGTLGSGMLPSFIADAVISYLEPLVRALAEAKDAAHSRGDEARYHMVTAINDHADLTKAYAAERAARQEAEAKYNEFFHTYHKWPSEWMKEVAAERQRADLAEAALRRAVRALITCRELEGTSSASYDPDDYNAMIDAALAAPSAARAQAEVEVLRAARVTRTASPVLMRAVDNLLAAEAAERKEGE